MTKEDMLNELNNIKCELSRMKDTHYYAANTYGSELCAGDMINKEKELEDKIITYEQNCKNNRV